MSDTLTLLKDLIRCPSVTPYDAGCQKIIEDFLRPLNFSVEHLRFGDVDNMWLRYGTKKPLLVFAGHTDVVPPGPKENWQSDPFLPTEKNGMLYGRGAADMKGGLAAMLSAAKQFLQYNPNPNGSIAFLITSDEEGPTNENGTQKVVQTLVDRNETIDFCIVGEASSEKKVGDQIRVGRRGSLGGKLTLIGKQGHVAFSNHTNPIHAVGKIISDLAETVWDQGNEFFPATTFQISNVHAGTGALNVVPGQLELNFNFRFCPDSTVESLKNKVKSIVERYKFPYQLHWEDPPSNPFLTQKGKLTQAVEDVVFAETNQKVKLSTGGGTSDGRFIAPTGAEVIELGPVNATIHQANECIGLADLETLTQLYKKIMEKLLL